MFNKQKGIHKPLKLNKKKCVSESDDGLKNILKCTFVFLTGASAIIDLFTALMNKPLFTRPSPPLTIQRRNLKEDITPSSDFPRARLVSDLYLSVTEV